MEINRDLIRWGLLIGAAPVWWPFVRTLWRDFNHALRAEGGLFGRPPSAQEVQRLERGGAGEPESLVNEPLVPPGAVRQPRLRGRTRAPATGRPPAAQRPGFQRPEPRRFRS
jgi:hypothetical protein